MDDSCSEVTTQQLFPHRILKHPHWDWADRWCLKQSRPEQTVPGCLRHSICPSLTSVFVKNLTLCQFVYYEFHFMSLESVVLHSLPQILEQNWVLKSRTRLATCSFIDVIVCVFPIQAVCMRLPPSAAEALEGTMQPCAARPRVHGSDAGCCLSCHVCFFQSLSTAFRV